MTDVASQDSVSPPPKSLIPGKVLGGRFVVEGRVDSPLAATIVRARDNKTGKPIALRMLPALFEDQSARDFLKAQCRIAAGVHQDHVVATYGLGQDGATMFIASEWLDGDVLSVVAKNRGAPFDLGMALEWSLKICRALESVGDITCHGAIRPHVIYVGPGDQLRVGDFGTARALLHAAGPAAFSASEQAYLAPEVKSGQAPDPRSDIFGIGALLYHLLTAQSPSDAFMPPSQTHPEASAAVDELILRCMNASPGSRFQTIDELAVTLRELQASAVSPPSEEVEVELESFGSGPPDSGSSEIDVSVESLNAHAVGMAPPIPAAPRLPAEAMGSPEIQPKEGVDLKALAAKVAADDTPWMVVIDAVDHGPFTSRGLLDRIVKREVLGKNVLFDLDFPDRRWKLEDHPDFSPFIEQAELKAIADEEQASLQKAERSEKTGTAFKVMVGVVALGAIAIGATLFILDRQAAERERLAEVDLGDLYETGEIDVTGTAQVLDAPRQRATGSRPRGSNGPSPVPQRRGTGPMTYEEAMNQPVDLGDVTQAGGEQQLSASAIQGVMNRHINSMYNCAVAELSRGGTLTNVRINLAIGGDGRVLGANPTQGSPAFRSCIQNQVMSIRFPTFSAPRMGASFSFSVDG